MNVADGYELMMQAALRGAAPDPEFWLDEWSERYMVLPKDSPRPGKYRLENSPMSERILRVLSPGHPCRRVVIRGASQMLKTQIGMNFLAGMAHRRPGNMLVLEPTTSLAKRLSARVSKTIRDVPELEAIFAKARSRDSRNSTFTKQFEGGAMHIATFGSAANLRELSAPYVYVDEVDGGERDVDGEGDAVMLAEARGTAFEDRAKFLHTSSPTVVGVSKIDELYEMGTQEVYRVHCPHCDHPQELLVENFHYERDAEDGVMARAWFVCPENGCIIEERDKFAMCRPATKGGTAHWHATSRGDGETLSFHVSAFYAGLGSITWLKLAREHARAKDLLEKGAPEAMQVFYNTRLALSWANTLEQTTSQELMSRADLAPRVIPDWALVVTTFADTQINRLEVQTHAWGPGLEHAVIDYQALMGSPTVPPDTPGSCWAQLDAYRATPWTHASGTVIYASAYGIDTGGANTQDVYNYASSRVQQGCIAAHGSSRPNRPIISNIPSKADVDWQGRRVDGGVMLWTIGSDTAKDHLHNRWKLASGWGAMHFNTALQAEWYLGLLAEVPRLKRKPGGGMRRVWDKVYERNEPLDLTVYNLALAHHLGLHKWAAADWKRLRDKLIPASHTPDLFAAADLAQLPAPTPAAPPDDQPAAQDPTGTEPPAAPLPTPPSIPMPQHHPAAPVARRVYSRGLA